MKEPKSLQFNLPVLLFQTEEEALAFAIQASLGGNQTAPDAQSKPPTINETDEDLALARALAQSEVDERNRQRQSRTTQVWVYLNALWCCLSIPKIGTNVVVFYTEKIISAKK